MGSRAARPFGPNTGLGSAIVTDGTSAAGSNRAQRMRIAYEAQRQGSLFGARGLRRCRDQVAWLTTHVVMYPLGLAEGRPGTDWNRQSRGPTAGAAGAVHRRRGGRRDPIILLQGWSTTAASSRCCAVVSRRRGFGRVVGLTTRRCPRTSAGSPSDSPIWSKKWSAEQGERVHIGALDGRTGGPLLRAAHGRRRAGPHPGHARLPARGHHPRSSSRSRCHNRCRPDPTSSANSTHPRPTAAPGSCRSGPIWIR